MTSATQAVVPVDDFVSDEIYPGYRPQYGTTPTFLEAIQPISKRDERHLWNLDFHFGRGIKPGSLTLIEDTYTWGTQMGAENIGLPVGRGLRARLAGTHLYMSPIATEAPWEVRLRAMRFGPFLQDFLATFEQRWAAQAAQLDAGFAHFRDLDTAALTAAELFDELRAAHEHHRRAWLVHFEFMYSLLANYLGFHELCGQLGLDPAQISRFLGGRMHKVLENDRALWQVAVRARELGVVDAIAAGDLGGVRGRVMAAPNGQAWWRELEAYLDEWGWRIDENCTLDTPPWHDDPTPALAAIRSFHGKGSDHDFDAGLRASQRARDEAIDEARAQIGKASDVAAFDATLASCQAANFSWWNDEHNHYIDKRAAVPAHKLTMELGRRLVDDGVLDAVDDVFYLLRQEIFTVLDDRAAWRDFTCHIGDRRDFHDHWRERIGDMPPVLGTVPERVGDPILIEVFGLSQQYLKTVRDGGSPAEEIRGLAASRGVVEGRARVIMAVADLHQLQPGEVLVSRGTDPDWTSAFGYATACVCDGGGSLSHAAIISREYGIPCVVGTGVATTKINTGDLVRVDGTNGIVEVQP